MDARDVILGVLGFALSFYGGAVEKDLIYVSGILLIILSMWLNIKDLEDNVRIINAQINTQTEIKKIWREIDELKQKR